MTSLAVAWKVPLYPSANGAATNHKPTRIWPTTAPAPGIPTRALVANRVTLQVTRGRSVCQRTGKPANSGDFEAEGWRMAVVLKTSVKNRPESSDSIPAIGYM